jgi:hypothetical protein
MKVTSEPRGNGGSWSRSPARSGRVPRSTRIDPRDIVEIVVEFDEGEEVHTPKINERFGSYDLNEAARYSICVRYEDDRMVCFVPEAGEEFYSLDDAHRVVGKLHKDSEILEWNLSSSQRHPGTGPYDTGAV